MAFFFYKDCKSPKTTQPGAMGDRVCRIGGPKSRVHAATNSAGCLKSWTVNSRVASCERRVFQRVIKMTFMCVR
eukprot:1157767-Pelagomonas_calceolata.AAC.2